MAIITTIQGMVTQPPLFLVITAAEASGSTNKIIREINSSVVEMARQHPLIVIITTGTINKTDYQAATQLHHAEATRQMRIEKFLLL